MTIKSATRQLDVHANAMHTQTLALTNEACHLTHLRPPELLLRARARQTSVSEKRTSETETFPSLGGGGVGEAEAVAAGATLGLRYGSRAQVWRDSANCCVAL